MPLKGHIIIVIKYFRTDSQINYRNKIHNQFDKRLYFDNASLYQCRPTQFCFFPVMQLRVFREVMTGGMDREFLVENPKEKYQSE
jgi:hypothetical protein